MGKPKDQEERYLPVGKLGEELSKLMGVFESTRDRYSKMGAGDSEVWQNFLAVVIDGETRKGAAEWELFERGKKAEDVARELLENTLAIAWFIDTNREHPDMKAATRHFHIPSGWESPLGQRQAQAKKAHEALVKKLVAKHGPSMGMG
jgi:hypothetical protein